MDASAQLLLEMVRNSGRKPYEQLPVAEARKQQFLGAISSQIEAQAVASVEELAAHSSAGPIPLRLYRGFGSTSSAPVMIYIHGGGWVLGSIATHDPLCRAIANAASCTVISVEYRLAPEHRFPAAVDDVIAAVQYIFGAASLLDINASRIVLGGDSAGANLALTATLALRQAGIRPIAGQILIYPALDMRMNSASHHRFDADLLLTHGTMLWFRELYLTDSCQQLDWRASPCLSPDLQWLPRTYVITAGCDPLSDEALEFIGVLRSHDIKVEHSHFNGQMHGFLTASRFIPEASQAITAIGNYLKRTLAT